MYFSCFLIQFHFGREQFCKRERARRKKVERCFEQEIKQLISPMKHPWTRQPPDVKAMETGIICQACLLIWGRAKG